MNPTAQQLDDRIRTLGLLVGCGLIVAGLALYRVLKYVDHVHEDVLKLADAFVRSAGTDTEDFRDFIRRN
jgi:hypothetical protein